MRATSIQRCCHISHEYAAGFEFRIWSGARDLTPGPHGPEIYAVSSTESDFEGFEFISTTQSEVWSPFQPPDSAGLLHELLHGSDRQWWRCFSQFQKSPKTSVPNLVSFSMRSRAQMPIRNIQRNSLGEKYHLRPLHSRWAGK